MKLAIEEYVLRQVLEVLEDEVDCRYTKSETIASLRSAIDQMEKVEPVKVTDEMVAAYLRANDDYWRGNDKIEPPIGKWYKGTVKQATKISLEAALNTTSAPAVPEKQEPVASMTRGAAYPVSNDQVFRNLPDGTLLYTHPAPAAGKTEPCKQCVEYEKAIREMIDDIERKFGTGRRGEMR